MEDDTVAITVTIERDRLQSLIRDSIEDAGAGQTNTGTNVGSGNGVSQSDADITVRGREELIEALDSASTGDTVFVPGTAEIDLQNTQYNVPSGVTLASNRGVNGSQGALLYTDNEPWKLVTINGNGRVTGIRLRGQHPGDDTDTYSAGVGIQTFGAGEVDNCAIRGFSYAAIRSYSGDGGHYHHNVISENNTGGYGYGVAARSGTPLIEYNYFNYNRHSVKSAGQNPGYIVRYNHFGPKATGTAIDAHEPAGIKYEVHNNIIEAVETTDGEPIPSIQVRGVPDDVYEIHNNWFWNPRTPLDSPNGWTEEAIIQPREDEWTNVTWWDNYYGTDASVTYSDIIEGYNV